MSQPSLAVLDGNRFVNLNPGDLSEEEQNTLVELALAILQERNRPGETLTTPLQVTEYIRLRLSEKRHEIFGVIFLDTRNRIITDEEMFHGTIDGARVHPRVVVQRALELNAAFVVFYHNHPSGIAEPSQADRKITEKLRDALNLVEVRVLDHILVGHEGACSFAERGLM
jgi:DNA repair protein RadC